MVNFNQMKKNKGGRPTKMTEETVKKLEEAFKMDFNDSEACSYTGISREIYYTHRKKDQIFLDRMDSAKLWVGIKAKKVVASAITDNGSVTDSWKWLEKRQSKEYGNKVVTENLNATIELNDLTEDERKTLRTATTEAFGQNGASE